MQCQDLLFGNVERCWLRITGVAKCSKMGLQGGLISESFFFYFWGASPWLPAGLCCFAVSWLWGSWGSAARECRGSRGCWSELGPYVRRHPRDWCNMERLRLWWMLSLVLVALTGSHLSWVQWFMSWAHIQAQSTLKTWEREGLSKSFSLFPSSPSPQTNPG